MYCKNCGSEMNDYQDICLKCGVRKYNGNSYCQNCGATISPNSDVCTSCGVDIKKISQSGLDGELAGQSKIALIVVCFFLGGLGIHNFMMGETKKGVFRIVTSFCFGLGYIFALIDLIKILVGSYVVEPDKLI